MAAWNELLNSLNDLSDDEANSFIQDTQQEALAEIAKLRGDQNVLFYASGWLQKPQAPSDRLSITPADLNGMMSVIHGMNFGKGLTLMLHTPGGSPTAAETMVAYLRTKFTYIEVIVPTYAMSAGTMMALASDKIIMGRQSQLGPIDPQFLVSGRPAMSTQGIVDQFERAKSEIVGTSQQPGNPALANVWAPVLASMGPSLLQDARQSLEYGERMVREWLEKYMFKESETARQDAEAAAHHFNDAASHKNHGRRIDRDEVRSLKIQVEDLESSQELQEAVLTAYHLATIIFEKSSAAKLMVTNHGAQYVQHFGEVVQQVPAQASNPSRNPGSPQPNREQRRANQKGKRNRN